MDWNNRIIRFGVALVVAGAIATQIPVNNGIALAKDGYGGRGGSGKTGRTVAQAVVGLTVVYGIYSTAVTPSGGGGGGTGGSGGTEEPPADPNEKKNVKESLWDVLNGRPDLSKFAELAELSGIKELLQDPKANYVAFVPNNAAFTDELLQDLTKPENKEKLAKFLKSYILDQKATIDELKTQLKSAPDNTKQFKNLNGDMVTLKLSGDVLSINDVRIIDTDIPASNAVIHPIGQTLP